MALPDVSMIGVSLYWSYANLAMAHAAVSQGVSQYQKSHFMIRSRLFKGLMTGKMDIGSIVEDERLKMILPQACSYCGNRQTLSVDHLIAKNQGGQDTGDNIVWACRRCNSSKGDTDLLIWFDQQGQFPALLLLRRYLKLAIEYARTNNILEQSVSQTNPSPFAWPLLPHSYPIPKQLTLWIIPLGQ